MNPSVAQQLPNEIVTQILHKAYSEHDWRREPSSNLSAYALISRVWTLPSQILLFRHITEARSRAFHDLMHLFLVPHHSNLTEYVKVLETSLVLHLDNSPQLGLTQPQLLFLVSHCPQLYELQLIVRGVFDLDISFQAYIRSHPHRIQALQLTGCSVESPILYSLLECMPSIQFLTLGCELSTLPPASPPRHRLYELCLHRTLGHVQLQWLLAASHSTLEVLELRDLPGAQTINTLLPLCPNIRSLRFINFNAKCAQILVHCSQLREILLWNLPSLFLITDLPSSMEHFSFVQYATASGADLSAIVRLVTNHPQLKLITCSPSARDNPAFPDLEKACRQFQVELKLELMAYWPAEYPIKSHNFPRPRSPSVYYLMH